MTTGRRMLLAAGCQLPVVTWWVPVILAAYIFSPSVDSMHDDALRYSTKRCTSRVDLEDDKDANACDA